MAYMPEAPERSKINQAPLEVRDYIHQLEKLARDGVKFREQISAEIKIGKVVRDGNSELDIQVKVITKRGNKTASNIPIKELWINGEEIIDGDGTEQEETNANGIWSKIYHTEVVEFLEFELTIEQGDGKTRKFSDTQVIQLPKEKAVDELIIISPEMDENNVISKTHDSFGSYIVLQTLCEKKFGKARVYMISDIHFQYKTGDKTSAAAKKHIEPVNGQSDLTILPSRDRQRITFFTDGVKPITIEFRK